MNTKKLVNLVRRFIVFLAMFAITFLGQTPPALAENTLPCNFLTSGKSMFLMGNCTVSSTVLIPDGFSLFGNGFTITAIDPLGGHFTGAVVKNMGKSANVSSLTITVKDLADICDSGFSGLIGIYFDGASGSISGNSILGLRQGKSGCQEGTGIEVSNTAISEPTIASTLPVTVKIMNNRIIDYQKTGILVTGNVTTTISSNTITGSGSVDYIVQNGIELHAGVKASITANTISGNIYSPQSFAASNLLVFGPVDGLTVTSNNLSLADYGMYLSGISNSTIKSNIVNNTVLDAIALTDTTVKSVNNLITANQIVRGGYGISVFNGKNNKISTNTIISSRGYGILVWSGEREGENTSENNVVTQNSVLNGGDDGIAIGGINNKISKNTSLNNGDVDISNSGDNSYNTNVCEFSSGPPVDCGVAILPE